MRNPINANGNTAAARAITIERAATISDNTILTSAMAGPLRTTTRKPTRTRNPKCPSAVFMMMHSPKVAALFGQ
jgi:hypothetical protein